MHSDFAPPQFPQVALSPHYIYSTHIPCSTRLAPVAAGLCRLINPQDRIALRIADRYGLTFEYKVARRHGLSPVEALDEWDMLTDEACRLLCT